MKKNILHINEVLKKKSNLNDQFFFDSNEIALILSSNLNVVMNHWIKFQQEWININYKKFKDHDKYILLIYLISKSWENNSSLFKFHSIDDYHSKIEIDLADISLLKIVDDLKIPKETIRRKLIELEKENIIKRKGQKITLFKLALNLQKPENSIKTLSIFFEKLSIILSAHDWFGPSISRKDVELYFKKFYTIFWYRYLKMQIPFLIRWKKIFGDLESWVIWANMGMNQNLNLEKDIKKIEAKKNVNLSKNNNENQYIEDIINMCDTQENKPIRGVNASSIADVSFIPRATVIRKLNKLVKKNIIKRNKKLEYFLNGKGKLNMKIKANYLINQKSIALFVTDIFNLIKKSSLKI